MRSYYQSSQKHHKTLYIIYSILSATALSLLLCISNTYADNVDYNVIVEPALNITTSGDTNGIVSLDLNPETHPFDSKDLNNMLGFFTRGALTLKTFVAPLY